MEKKFQCSGAITFINLFFMHLLRLSCERYHMMMLIFAMDYVKWFIMGLLRAKGYFVYTMRGLNLIYCLWRRCWKVYPSRLWANVMHSSLNYYMWVSRHPSLFSCFGMKQSSSMISKRGRSICVISHGWSGRWCRHGRGLCVLAPLGQNIIYFCQFLQCMDYNT